MLVDVPATDLGADKMKLLQSYVRDVGRGLVMVGGKESFGAGGYTKTPLEETLPVDMDVRDRQKQPDVALVVVIDKSGSMDACHCNTANRDIGTAIPGVPKVDIGKEAILRAVSALTERDEFGVVAFDENAHWIINTQPLAGVGDVEDQIAGINPNGTTNIFAGLSAAVEQLEHTTAQRRHIVLLTDGWSSSGEYTDLLARMKAANITLCAVGAGGGASPFLQTLAEQGGGRYYAATNPASIPDIFLKETQQVSGQQIVEEPFFPIQTGDSPILRRARPGPAAAARLQRHDRQVRGAVRAGHGARRPAPGAVAVRPRSGGGVDLRRDRDVGQELGRLDRLQPVLLAAGARGRSPARSRAAWRPSSSPTATRRACACTRSETDGTPRNFYDTTVRLTSPEFDPVSVRLDQVAPGVYEAPLGILTPGAYALRIDQTQPGATPLGRTVVLVAPTAGRVPAAGHERAAADGAARRDRRARRWPGKRRRPKPGRTPSARRRRHATCGRGCCCWRCCCGRWTWRSGASRSGGATWSPRGRGPAPGGAAGADRPPTGEAPRRCATRSACSWSAGARAPTSALGRPTRTRRRVGAPETRSAPVA